MKQTEEKTVVEGGVNHLPNKMQQVLASRKVWAGITGLVTTLGLWALGEIDGARAVEAITWVLGILIGSVALEDGMTRLLGVLVGEPKREANSE